jgi:hypothetical protein
VGGACPSIAGLQPPNHPTHLRAPRRRRPVRSIKIKAPQIRKGGGLLAGTSIGPANGNGKHGDGLLGMLFGLVDDILG